MEKEKLEGLIHIVASRASKKIENVQKSGENWLNFFVENKLIEDGYKILDYGAGLGRVSIPFSRIAEVTSIDGNPDMVEYLRENNINAYLSSNCDPVMDQKFDFVISNFVLQHMHFPDAQELVSQISKITDRFYFTYPIIEDGGCDSYIYFKESFEVELLKSHDISRKMHLSELPILFEKTNFKTESIKRLFSNLFVINK